MTTATGHQDSQAPGAAPAGPSGCMRHISPRVTQGSQSRGGRALGLERSGSAVSLLSLDGQAVCTALGYGHCKLGELGHAAPVVSARLPRAPCPMPASGPIRGVGRTVVLFSSLWI